MLSEYKNYLARQILLTWITRQTTTMCINSVKERKKSHTHTHTGIAISKMIEARKKTERKKEVIKKSSSRDIELNLLTQRVELKVYLVIYDYIAM